MRDIAEVELVTAITGYLKRWSVIAKTYLLLGKEPKQSMLTVHHTFSGILVGWTTDGGLDQPVA